jgi:hypothetical protein
MNLFKNKQQPAITEWDIQKFRNEIDLKIQEVQENARYLQKTSDTHVEALTADVGTLKREYAAVKIAYDAVLKDLSRLTQRFEQRERLKEAFINAWQKHRNSVDPNSKYVVVGIKDIERIFEDAMISYDSML